MLTLVTTAFHESQPISSLISGNVRNCVCTVIEITQIEPGAFNGLVSIQTIYLGYNRITTIPDDIPADVIWVYINSNAITRIPANIFSHLSQCTHLDLSRNQITDIEPGAFNGLISVRRIDLGHNRMKMILGLSQNSLTILPTDELNRLQSLKELELSYNRLTTLPADVFSHIPRPLELAVHNNPLICDAALCWLKQEELQGTITGTSAFASLKTPCANGVDWETWVCTVPGKSI